MIIWGVFLPPPLKAGTEYILRHYYQYPQRLRAGGCICTACYPAC